MSATAFALPDVVVLVFASFLVGLRRAGLQGPAILAVSILAVWYPASAAVGIGVSLFIHADVQAVLIVGRGVDARRLFHFLVPALVGVAVAAPVGTFMDDRLFDWALLILLLAAYSVLVYQWLVPARNNATIPPALTLLAGFLVGFSSMIGNLASVFLIVYFSVARSTKEGFVALSAWFFLIVNLVKLPIHIWIWETLTWEMLLFSLAAIPTVPLGILAGRWLVRNLSERLYWTIANAVAGVAVIRYTIAVVWR